MFSYQILNNPCFDLDIEIIQNIFKSIDKKINKAQKWTLNIVFVSPDEIKELNKNYREKDYSTDVLSFHYYDNFISIRVIQTNSSILKII